jgi:hypothetical protein
MVSINQHQLIITVNIGDPQIFLDRLREGITDISSAFLESESFKQEDELSSAVSTLIQLQAQLFTAE